MSNGDRGDGSSGARVVHIKRIFQDDDPESNAWIDIERLDELHLIVAGTQRVHYIFNWDVLESEGYDGPKKTIVNPNDDTSTIDIPIRQIIHVVGPKGKVAHQFLNGQDNLSRKTHSRRIYHHEIKDSYLVEGKPPRDPNDYLKSLGDQDKDQFVDVEIIDEYITTGFDKDDIHGHSQILANGVPKDSNARTQRKTWQQITDDPFMNEPLLESDKDGGNPGFIFLRNPAAGPTIDPPWRLDPLQNIVNISWGANLVFIAGGNQETIIYGKIKTKQQITDNKVEPEELGALGFSGERDFGAACASAYHDVRKSPDDKKQPVFLLGGTKPMVDPATSQGHSHGIIMASKNGLDWQTVADIDYPSPTVDHPINDVGVVGFAWDEKDNKFYASVGSHRFRYVDPETQTQLERDIYENLWASSDGRSWSEVGEQFISTSEGNPDPTPAPPSLLKPHFNQHAKLPDGQFGYEEKTDEDDNVIESFLAVPTSPPPLNAGDIVSAFNEKPATTIKITIRGPDGQIETEDTYTLPLAVNCVTYAGGVLIAAGRVSTSFQGVSDFPAVIAASTDKGENWTIIKKDTDALPGQWTEIFTISAGELSAIK